MIEAADIRQPESAATGEAKGYSLHSPVVPHPLVTLYNGDCLDILPQLAPGLVYVCDQP